MNIRLVAVPISVEEIVLSFGMVVPVVGEVVVVVVVGIVVIVGAV